MRFLYSGAFGGALGIGSIFLHSLLPPYGLLLSFLATGLGIWSIGRAWGGRACKIMASFIWMAIVLRAGFPGASDEFLIQGNAVGTSLINFGFLILVTVILIPA